MIRKLTLAAGFGAGYVLGAKAGTQRYDQIVAKFRELAGMPAVQDLTSNLSQTASTLGDKAKETVNDTVASVSDKVSGGSDSVTPKPPATTPPATTPPVAAPSASAPDTTTH